MLVEVGLIYPSPTGYGVTYPLRENDMIVPFDLFKELRFEGGGAAKRWETDVGLPFDDDLAEEVLLSNVVGAQELTVAQSDDLLKEACRIASPAGQVVVRDELGSLDAYAHLLRTTGFDIREYSPGGRHWPYLRRRYNLGPEGMIFMVSLGDPLLK